MIQPARMFTSVVMCLFTLSVIAGCGGGGEETSAPIKPTSSSPEKKTSDAGSEKKGSESEEPETASGIGSFSGTITVTGTIPELKPLVAKGDPSAKDPTVCAVEAVPDEEIVVGEGNGLANVFVYLLKAPKGAPQTEAPTNEIEFDQKGCRFFPHAMVLQTTQKVKAISSDAVPHNLHTWAVKNNQLNQTISANDKSGLIIEYPIAELLPFKVTCDIHTWMKAWQLPLDHPYAAVTDENGHFKIENLPAGKHVFRVWHEKAGYLEKEYEVTIEDGKDTPASLEYPIDKVNKE